MHSSTCFSLPYAITYGSKKRGKEQVEEEVVCPSKLMTHKQSSHKNVKSTAARGKKPTRTSIKDMPYLEYKEL
jgi:hypothetical protein